VVRTKVTGAENVWGVGYGRSPPPKIEIFFFYKIVVCARGKGNPCEQCLWSGGKRSVRNPKIPSSVKNRVICNEMRLFTCLYACTWKVTCRYKCVDSELQLEIRFFPSRISVNKIFS
jgi:hypothetical protein